MYLLSFPKKKTHREAKKTGRRKQRRYKYNCIITTTTIEKKKHNVNNEPREPNYFIKVERE